ncbi:hypothetical protein D1007_39133 [Hordeum vulgare]|nr:hypothetical protein D1007_39133 [Hordeum vulgare]
MSGGELTPKLPSYPRAFQRTRPSRLSLPVFSTLRAVPPSAGEPCQSASVPYPDSRGRWEKNPTGKTIDSDASSCEEYGSTELDQLIQDEFFDSSNSDEEVDMMILMGMQKEMDREVEYILNFNGSIKGRRVINRGRISGAKGHIDDTERNRASPQAICKLYKHINEDQRAAIRDMGTGAFLDIKCGYLHNTLVTWFTRLYHSGRKGFVVPRRGFIPLTEEFVHKILGIPRGDIEMKYEADYDNEDEIASSLFPRDGSRPKITTVATAIINNNNGDASLRSYGLFISSQPCWLLQRIQGSATSDTPCWLNLCKFVVAQLHEHLSKGKFTKGCPLYCMLRYLDALDCDGMELELPDTPYTVNAWSKTHVDVVAEMDMLEHDPPSFGNFQGLTAPATRNTTTSRIKRGTEARESDDTSSEDSEESDNDTNEHNVNIERDKKKRMTREEDITRGNVESPLMKNVRDVAGEMENTTYDPSQGANFFGGARETEVCDNTSSGDPSAQFDTKSPSRSTSHLNLPSDSDMSSPDNNSPADILVSLISEGNSQELEEKIRGSAAGLANRLCELKSTRPADIEQGDGSTHEEINASLLKSSDC